MMIKRGTATLYISIRILVYALVYSNYNFIGVRLLKVIHTCWMYL